MKTPRHHLDQLPSELRLGLAVWRLGGGFQRLPTGTRLQIPPTTNPNQTTKIGGGGGGGGGEPPTQAHLT